MPLSTKPEEIVPETTSNWKIYRNEKYRFEVRYPKDWYEVEYPLAKEKGLFSAGFSTDGTKTNVDVMGNMKSRWAMVECTREDWKEDNSIRNFFKESKNPFNAGKMLSQKFGANEAYLHLVVIAYNCFSIFKKNICQATGKENLLKQLKSS